MEKNKLITENMEVRVSGYSDSSKEKALNNAFAELKREVAQRVNGVIVYMRPIYAEVEEYKTDQKTERYLGILFSRKRVTHSIKLKVTVEVSTIDF